MRFTKVKAHNEEEKALDVWRLMAHHIDSEAVVDWSRENGRIAIGWGLVGNIVGQGYSSPKEIAQATRIHYPYIHNAPLSGVQLWNFCHTIKPKDLVIVSTGKRRALVMQVQGDYEFRPYEQAPLSGDYQHQRTAQVTAIDPDRLWRLAGSSIAAGHNIRWTLVKCLEPVEADAL